MNKISSNPGIADKIIITKEIKPGKSKPSNQNLNKKRISVTKLEKKKKKKKKT